MNLALFDTRPVALAQEPEPQTPRRENHDTSPSGVVRILTLKAGDFTELRRDQEGRVVGLTGRTFRILELADGRFLRQWSDGVVDAAPPAVNPIYVSDGLRYGTFVEVRP